MYNLIKIKEWLRRFSPALLLAATFPLSMLHTLWANEPCVVNWIWLRPTPMLLQWNVKFAVDQILQILIVCAMYLYGVTPKNRVNKEAVTVYLIWVILDTVVYFVNYKTYGYGAMYLWLAAITILVHFGKDISRYLWKTLDCK